jgi:hypothetical protein
VTRSASIFTLCLVLLLAIASAARSHASSEAQRPVLQRSYGGSVSQRACVAEARRKELGHAVLVGAPTRVRVHYSLTGRDALPARSRRDRDRNGVPDYVECVQAAASAALEFYEAENFRSPRRDHAGGDTRTDIYLVRQVAQGAYGKTEYSGGAHVLLRNDLEQKHPLHFKRRTGKQVYQGLWMTVTHELFHVIQSQYLPTSAIPTWISEGTANAWSTMMMQEETLDAEAHVETWLDQSHLSVYGTRKRDCQSCYGSANFWMFYEFAAGIRPDSPDLPLVGPTVRLFERLAALHAAGKRIGLGWSVADAAFKSAYPSRDPSSFATFIDVLYPITGATPSQKAKWPAYDEPFPRATTRPARRTLVLPPLSAARVPIPLPAGQTPTALEVTVRAPRHMHAFLALGGGLGTRLDLDMSRTSTTWRVVPSKDLFACGLQGTPSYMPLRQWADISTIGPEEPRIACARDTLDLVAANFSGGKRGRLNVTYRLLQPAPEVPGVDAVGDVAAGGPDIRRVAVQVAPDVVRFGVDIVGASPSALAMGVYMDTDENTATGASSGPEQGSDYVLVVRSGAETSLFAWANGAWQVRPEPSAFAQYNAGTAYPFVAQLHPRAISDPLRIRFYVVAEVGTGSASPLVDAAPSSGRWTTATWRGYWTR